MFRSLERSENTARLLEAGFRIALTRSSDSASEWKSVITTAGVRQAFDAKHDGYTAANVTDFLLRESTNPSSVLSAIESARTNARMVRIALTTEVWESVNENWMTLKDALKRPVRETDLPTILGTIRRQSSLVRGALHGTMLRYDIYDFAQAGTALERFDSTARILDVKYYTLLPSASFVGSSLDNVQWDTILRAVSAHRAFHWINEKELTPASVAQFLMLDNRFPRSLAFCASNLKNNLDYLADDYGQRMPCHEMADALCAKLEGKDISEIIEDGLHETISTLIRENNAVGAQIEKDYQFNG